MKTKIYFQKLFMNGQIVTEVVHISSCFFKKEIWFNNFFSNILQNLFLSRSYQGTQFCTLNLYNYLRVCRKKGNNIFIRYRLFSTAQVVFSLCCNNKEYVGRLDDNDIWISEMKGVNMNMQFSSNLSQFNCIPFIISVTSCHTVVTTGTIILSLENSEKENQAVNHFV